jgi:hypothetical protein
LYQGVVHQYQIVHPHSEFAGLIIPGGSEEFFRFVGEPYSGPLFPSRDNRPFHQALLPKLMAATEKFDMVPVRDHPSIDPQAWNLEADVKLPEGTQPYFLKANYGPK